jgi:hypothetical protein
MLGVVSVGFCGSRCLPGSFRAAVARVVSAVQAAGARVLVGCAPGADRFVRWSAAGCQVFSVRSGQFGSGRAAFARRSSALVAAVGSGSAFVGFVSLPCPARVWPSASSHACFCGGGSGSWASLALAAGRGVESVVVFWCGAGPAVLPCWGGSWVPASGVFAGGWQFVPRFHLALF